MGRVNSLVSAFTSGEISERLYGRSDIEIYNAACKKLTNFWVQPQGGITRRDGTIYEAECSNNLKQSRLIPFLQADSFSYAVELSDLNIRVFRENAQIRESSKTVSGATAANPVVITATAHGYSNGDVVYISGVVGMAEINQRWFTVANKNTNDFELSGEDGSSHGAYASAGTAEKVIEVTSTYLEADLNQIQFAQDQDTLYLVHPSYAPRVLTRTSHTAWTLTACTFLDGPYMAENATGTTLAASGTTGSVTITASATTGINDGAGFKSTDVGRFIRIKSSSAYGYVKVTAFTSSTVVTATVITTLDGTVAATTWRMGSFSDTTGYPGCVSFFEGRLMLAGTTKQPTTIWGSKTGLYLDHEPGANDDDALDYTSAKSTSIYWLGEADNELFAGCAGGIWNVSADAPPLTPSNTFVHKQSAGGVARIMPAASHNSLLFVRRGRKGLHKLGLDPQSSRKSYINSDISILAEHLARENSNFAQVAWQEDEKRCWVLCGNGDMATYTMVPETGIAAWTKITTSGDFESVCVIPNYGSNGDSVDEVWVTVKRTINGVTKRFVEYFSPNVDTDAAAYNASLSGSSMTGLQHLNGESVKIRGDGAVVPDNDVAAGVVVLGFTYTVCEAGLSYNMQCHLLPYEVGSQSGTGQGARKRNFQIYLHLLETLGGTVNGDDIIYRSAADEMGESVPVFSGWKKLSIDSSWEEDPIMEIEGSAPLDFTITALVQRIVVGDA